jgi:hypothetical protein
MQSMNVKVKLNFPPHLTGLTAQRTISVLRSCYGHSGEKNYSSEILLSVLITFI